MPDLSKRVAIYRPLVKKPSFLYTLRHMQNQTNSIKVGEFAALMENQSYFKIPVVGDLIKGKVIALGNNEVRVDIDGFKTGVVRGYELFQGTGSTDLKLGDEVEATVMEVSNERGEVELSFRFVGLTRAWGDLLVSHKSGTIVDAKITEVNKGGLIAVSGNMSGFLPVSQLAPEHYPRVQGGDKSKILEKLREFIGLTMRVKVLDISPEDNKLIFSEKAVWEEDQKDLLSRFKVGEPVEGKITAIADFGAFMSFDGLEGLIHISEIAWQRLDHPGDLLKIGDMVKAQIVGIEGSKIFLSMRRLIDDPWKHVGERYTLNGVVDGKVLKVNPFGLFVELDPEIHGLAHVSELELAAGERIESKIKPNDVLKFKIISLEPDSHRLGLSQKALNRPDVVPGEEKPEEKKEEAVAEKKEEPAPAATEEKAAE